MIVSDVFIFFFLSWDPLVLKKIRCTSTSTKLWPKGSAPKSVTTSSILLYYLESLFSFALNASGSNSINYTYH